MAKLLQNRYGISAKGLILPLGILSLLLMTNRLKLKINMKK